MSRLFNNITETHPGKPRWVKLNRVAAEANALADIYIKCEFFQPAQFRQGPHRPRND